MSRLGEMSCLGEYKKNVDTKRIKFRISNLESRISADFSQNFRRKIKVLSGQSFERPKKISKKFLFKKTKLKKKAKAKFLKKYPHQKKKS